MSKFRKLLNKFGKKKKPEDQEDEFYSDVDEQILDDEEDLDEEFFSDVENDIEDEDFLEDLGEETVLLDAEEIGDELLPHESQGEAQIPPDSELTFPAQKENTDATSPINDIKNLNQQSSPEENETGFIDDDSTKEISLSDFNDSLEDDDEELIEQEEVPEFSEMKIPSEEEQDEFETLSDDEYSDLSSDYANTTSDEVLELDGSDLNMKDKLSHAMVRAGDRLRSLKTKKVSNSNTSSQVQNQFNNLKSKAVNLNWSNIPKALFDKKNRGIVHRYFQGAMAITLTYSVSSILGSAFLDKKDYNSLQKQSFLEFDQDAQLSKKDFSNFKSAKLLKTEKVKVEAPKKKRQDIPEVCKTATKPSKANIKLVNTIILQDSVKSIASVQARSKDLIKIRQGDTLSNGKFKVDRIERLKLIVKNTESGDCEYIENSDKPRDRKQFKTFSKKASKTYKKKLSKLKGIETDGTNFKIDKKFLKSKMSDISAILTQAKGTPIQNEDGTLSFAISQVDPEGVFAYLGIENGDIITEINGEPIKELNEVMKLFGRISNVPKLNLTVNRNGQVKPLNYNIE